jgi:hypothetical protein
MPSLLSRISPSALEHLPSLDDISAEATTGTRQLTRSVPTNFAWEVTIRDNLFRQLREQVGSFDHLDIKARRDSKPPMNNEGWDYLRSYGFLFMSPISNTRMYARALSQPFDDARSLLYHAWHNGWEVQLAFLEDDLERLRRERGIPRLWFHQPYVEEAIRCPRGYLRLSHSSQWPQLCRRYHLGASSVFRTCHEAYAIALEGGISAQLVQLLAPDWFEALQAFPPNAFIANANNRSPVTKGLSTVKVEEGIRNRVFGLVQDASCPGQLQDLWYWPPVNVARRNACMASGAAREMDQAWIKQHALNISNGTAVARSIPEWDRFLRLKPDKRRFLLSSADKLIQRVNDGQMDFILERLDWPFLNSIVSLDQLALS